MARLMARVQAGGADPWDANVVAVSEQSNRRGRLSFSFDGASTYFGGTKYQNTYFYSLDPDSVIILPRLISLSEMALLGSSVAAAVVEDLLRVLDRYSRLQRALGIPDCHCVTSYDIKAITTDNCSEIAGVLAGAAMLLDAERLKCYERLREQGVKLGEFQRVSVCPALFMSRLLWQTTSQQPSANNTIRWSLKLRASHLCQRTSSMSRTASSPLPFAWLAGSISL